MDSAEVYMTLIRPSMVPVFGEASPLEFTGQIELANWSWTLKNEEEDNRAAKAAKAYNDRASFLEHRDSTDLRKQIQQMNKIKARISNQRSYSDQRATLQKQLAGEKDEKKRAEIFKELTTAEESFRSAQDQANEDFRVGMWNLEHAQQIEAKRVFKETTKIASDLKQMDESIKGLSEAADKADARSKYDNFEFSFSKRVDIATTQMLNSMKAGDVFPMAILTLYQRAAKFNQGASLIITVEKLRLLDYQLKCEVSDTMTDMREEWTAEFYSMAYVYKNRGQIKKESGIGQMVTAAVTQGTVRTFTMKNSSLPSLPI
jgi:type VI protein secretion system component Hcp